MQPIRRLIALGVAGTLAGASLPASAAGNLEVLPLELSAASVLAVMRLMTLGLGTECAYCHRTEINDYASDARPPKVLARAMLRLEEKNRGGIDWRAPPDDLCRSCHRGRLRPYPVRPRGAGNADLGLPVTHI